MNSIRIALVEDNEVIRTLTYRFLAAQPELQGVMVSASAEDFLAQLVDAIPPQVILLDIGLPGMSGLEAIPHILKRAPQALILIQTVIEDKEIIHQALRLGAMGYVLKSMLLTELKEAMLELARGGTPFSRSVSRTVLSYFKPLATQPSLLSTREQQVHDALTGGLSNSQIAVLLGLGIESVRTYVSRVYRKLKVRSRTELFSHTLHKRTES